MLKKKKIILLAFAFSIFAVLSLNSVNATTPPAAGVAGSVNDPLVTAGYVAKYIAEILELQEQATAEMIQEAVSKAMQNINPGYVTSTAGANASYDVLTLVQNDKIRAKSGTLEIIVRPGSEAEIISYHTEIGVADITAGRELLNGEPAPINNALLVPRADGRGLRINSGIAYIMVRGDYEIYQ